MGASQPVDNIRFHVCSEREFLEAVRAERVRCDRTGQAFSVVELECGKDQLSRQQIADRLSARLRSCDRVGLLNEREIAIMLPSTDRDGAERLIGQIRRVLAEDPGRLTSRVSSYPTSAGVNDPDQATGARYSPLDEALAPLCTLSIPRWKRVLDIIGAAVGLILFAPYLLLLPVYIKIVSPGPILFRQQRVGYRGRVFTFLKFRTMRPDNDSSHHQEHLSSLIRSDRPMTKLDAHPGRKDARIIPGGNVLRKLALDEIPQFLNILRGEMSLVGPRPCIPYEAAEYSRWHTQRFDVMPGLTGLWQVSGKNKLSFAAMVRLDNTYARTMSFWLDVKILLLTFPALFVMAVEAAVGKLVRRGGRVGN